MTSVDSTDNHYHVQYINWYPGIAAAIFYGLMSGLMSFMNKIVLTTFDYRYPEVLMLAQVVSTAIVLEICRRQNLVNITPYTLHRGKKFLLPSICFAFNTVLALNALSDLSIPMYNVLRRLIPLTTLLLGACILSKKPSFQLTCSIILVVLGCIIAGFGDLSFHLGGYASAILSVCSQSTYLVYVQKTGVENGLSTLDVLHLNSINCIPLLAAYTLYSNRLIDSFHSISVTAKGFFPVFMVDVLMGCVLNYSLFLCATMNTALTTSLVGVIKGVITTLIGFFTFGGVAVNTYTLCGIVLNTFGGLLYFFTKYRDNIMEKFEEENLGHYELVNVENVTSKGQDSQNSNTKEDVTVYISSPDNQETS